MAGVTMRLSRPLLGVASRATVPTPAAGVNAGLDEEAVTGYPEGRQR